ncbi:MAG: FkbM family methyltransferase, partial [Acidobacteriota bacterium]|nr:FkbM family methyltransferase [Acidobacteriota bacterium]
DAHSDETPGQSPDEKTMNPALRRYGRRVLPRAMRVHRILGGPLKGARISTSWHDYPGALLGRTERPLLAWFAANVAPGETWLDVGAQYGYTSIALSRLVGPEGRVFSFEPVIETAGHLHRTKMANRFSQMTVVPLALGDSAVLDLARVEITRGMASPARAGAAMSLDLLSMGFDALRPSLGLACAPIHGVKIDVQGFEIAVLRGMREMLSDHRPRLIVELHNGVGREEFLTLIAGIGYTRDVRELSGEPATVLRDDISYVFTADNA